MFSATFAPRIMELASHVMREPQKIELATARDTHGNIEQRLHWFDDMAHRTRCSSTTCGPNRWSRRWCSPPRRSKPTRLADELREATIPHPRCGAMPQTLRNRRIKSMRDSTIKVLIATDVAARGIDVPTIARHQLWPADETGRLRAPHRPYRCAGRSGRIPSRGLPRPFQDSAILNEYPAASAKPWSKATSRVTNRRQRAATAMALWWRPAVATVVAVAIIMASGGFGGGQGTRGR